MRVQARILLIEDDEGLRSLIEDELSDANFEVFSGASVAEAISGLEVFAADLVVTDLRLPDGTGMDVLEACRELPGEIQPSVVLVTAFGDVPTAVEALKAGADEFLTKPLDLDHLRLRVERLAATHRLRRRMMSWEFSDDELFHGIVGKSPAMRRVFYEISKIAGATGPVLILGESGVGKELVAKAIHRESSRRTGPFVAVNCAGVPEDLLESEFFGHAEGAFSGAAGARKGLFREADGGTILLDEIGELSPGLQAKLLRVLQEGSVRAVGSDRPVEIDVRVLAATNRELAEDVEAKSFREDLYYRLSTFVLRVPPLRERPDDIELLAGRFLMEVSAGDDADVHFDADALDALRAYAFPGNVRELKNIIERAFTFRSQTAITRDDLPAEIAAGGTERDQRGPGYRVDRIVPLDQVKREYSEWALRRCEGNKRRTAKLLGIGRRTLYRYLEE